MMLNDEQESYVSYLNSLHPSMKCWCGWYKFGECYNCSSNDKIKDKNCQDKINLACDECGSYPTLPDYHFHKKICSRYEL